MKNVMVDLETLGNGSKAAIIAIGAVEFDANGLGREFYTVVDAQSSVDLGLEIDASTVMWWLQQDVKAREAFKSDGVNICEALFDFREWYPVGAKFWGNGATFDNVILANAYKLYKVEQPWNFWDDRCYRTLKNLFPRMALKRVGVAHNALDDARSQATHCIELLKHIDGGLL